MVFLTFILIVVTAFYAFFTFRILQANQKATRVMEAQLEASTRPYIAIKTFTVHESQMILLSISNTGKSAAEELKFQIDKDFYRYGRSEEGFNLRELNLFKNIIGHFQPETKLVYNLVDAVEFFGEQNNIAKTPLQFTITAEYKYLGKNFTEKTVVDLNQHRDVAMNYDPFIGNLKKIADSIEKISKK